MVCECQVTLHGARPGGRHTQPIGLVVADESLGRRVPLQFPSHLAGDVSELAERAGTVADLRILQGLSASLHAVEEVAFLVLQGEREILRLHLAR